MNNFDESQTQGRSQKLSKLFARCSLWAIVIWLGTWASLRILDPPTEDDKRWAKFHREISSEPAFAKLKIESHKGVHWVTGRLQTPTELERLLAIAENCGIRDRRLDGPYKHSISIIIPGTDRAEEYH